MADQLQAGDTAHLTSRELAMLRYAEQLARAPSTLRRMHVDALRRAGLTDREIHDVAQVAAYFAYANRVVLGLGAELGRAEGAFGQWPPTRGGPVAERQGNGSKKASMP